MKILYAADNRASSYYTLKRFVDTYSKFYTIKTAAYLSSIQELNVNWTLNALLDFRGWYYSPSFKNTNYALYFRQIKKFAPDLIISDMEPYTSHIALEQQIPLWQVSPLLIYSATQDKHNLYKYYSGVFDKDPQVKQHFNYILNNSDKRLVLSHIGDLPNAPDLLPGYEWCRPNYVEGNISLACGISFADAFYGGEKDLTKLTTDYTDPESIITTQYYKDYNTQQLTINDNVKFLSQHLNTAGYKSK